MRKNYKVMVTGAIAAVLISVGSAAAYAASAESGAAGALTDNQLTIEEMLTYAIQDEYAASAEYETIIDTYGEQIPYTNISRAEEVHIARLTQLFDDYGYTLPADTSEVTVPDSLEASYAVGVTAEENNIAMYEKFLKETLPADVKLVFEQLLRASQRHLSTFQNAVAGNLTDCLGTGHQLYGQGNGSGTYGVCQSSGSGTGSSSTGGGRGSRGGMCGSITE